MSDLSKRESGHSLTSVRQDIEGVAVLTLQRPDRRNALNQAMIAELSLRLGKLGRDEKTRVIAIRGSGGIFCAGADLAELARSQEAPPETGLREARALGSLFLALRRHPKPVVALVEGAALGGGAGLALACDMVLAAEDARFGFPEVRLGFVPALVAPLLLERAPSLSAFELVASGRSVSARSAAEIGLATRVFERSAFDAEARKTLLSLSRRPPGAMTLTKRIFYDALETNVATGISRGAAANALARRTSECRSGVRRFLTQAKE